jgi:hypothetical protein
MLKKYLSFGFLLLFFGLTLSAQAQSTVSVHRPLADKELKSVSKARFLALSNTAMAVGTGLATVALFDNNTVQKTGAYLGVYGILMAPATGNFYALDYPRGIVGIGTRAIGAWLMIDATREIFGNEFADQLNVDDQEVSLTDTKILIGEALVLGSIVYNVLSAKQSVEEFNADQGKFALNINSERIHDKVAPVLTARFNF